MPYPGLDATVAHCEAQIGCAENDVRLAEAWRGAGAWSFHVGARLRELDQQLESIRRRHRADHDECPLLCEWSEATLRMELVRMELAEFVAEHDRRDPEAAATVARVLAGAPA